MDLWFTEKQTPLLASSLKVKSLLHHEKSPFQEISVLETEQYGRLLALDSVIQTTEADEFTYHEMIAHVPLAAHPAPSRVLVIGGGDGGTIREALKHPPVEEATLCEIDRRVVEVSKEFLPALSSGFSDPRCRFAFEDGIQFVKRAEEYYDVIIVDSTDPVGPAVGLFAEDFYRDVSRALKPDGIFVAQTESPFLNRELIRRVYSTVSGIFPIARIYLTCVPTYPGGIWSFTLGSKRYDPLALDGARMERVSTRYYNPELHSAAFVLPVFLTELLAGRA